MYRLSIYRNDKIAITAQFISCKFVAMPMPIRETVCVHLDRYKKSCTIADAITFIPFALTSYFAIIKCA